MVVKSPSSCDLGFVEILLYYLLAKNDKKREGNWVSRISHEKELSLSIWEQFIVDKLLLIVKSAQNDHRRLYCVDFSFAIG